MCIRDRDTGRKIRQEGIEKMGKFAEKAVANHKKKYNCAQAVACAFCEELGRDEKMCIRDRMFSLRS